MCTKKEQIEASFKWYNHTHNNSEYASKINTKTVHLVPCVFIVWCWIEDEDKDSKETYCQLLFQN